MEPLERPRAIITYCLEPLGLNSASETYVETVRRLEHVIKTLQGEVGHLVAVDFSRMPSIVINEAAHGYE